MNITSGSGSEAQIAAGAARVIAIVFTAGFWCSIRVVIEMHRLSPPLAQTESFSYFRSSRKWSAGRGHLYLRCQRCLYIV